MNKKVKVDDLAKAIEQSLKDFQGVTDQACVDGVLDTAQEAVKELHLAHPAGTPVYQSWAKYNKGWGMDLKKKKSSVMSIVHNKTEYRLAHLLEKGHALKHGGRKVGETRAFPHIEPVAEKAEKELLENIKKRIGNG